MLLFFVHCLLNRLFWPQLNYSAAFSFFFTHLPTWISILCHWLYSVSLSSITYWLTKKKNVLCPSDSLADAKCCCFTLICYKLLVCNSLFQLSVVERITFTAQFLAHDAANSLADLSAMIHAVWLLRSALSGCLALHMRRTCLDHLDLNTSAFWLLNWGTANQNPLDLLTHLHQL